MEIVPLQAEFFVHRHCCLETTKFSNVDQTYLQELFYSSETVLGCIPSPKTRVIHRSLLFDAIDERREPPSTEDQGKEPLLEQILKAIEATEETTHVEGSSENLVHESNEGKIMEESSENLMDKNEDERNDVTEETTAEQGTEKVSKLVAALEKLEQVHREENEILVEANRDLNNPGVTKVSKMQKKIRNVKVNLSCT